MAHYSDEELLTIFGSVGSNVKVDRLAAFYNPKQIFISSNVRIDCFCVLSAGEQGIFIGNNVHISSSAHLFGSGGEIIVSDFAGISSRVSLFTSNDDYKEGYLTGPTVRLELRKVKTGSIKLGKHALIGCGSIILPGVEIGIGASIGALSLVAKSVSPFQIMGGIPAKKIGERSRQILEKEAIFAANEQLNPI